MPTTYTHKPTTISASPYAAGLEDGFTTFTSGTVSGTAIPPALQRIALLWVVEVPTNEWAAHVPYINNIDGTSNKVYLYPDDYIEYPGTGGKVRWSKTDFENQWDTSAL